MSDSHLNLKIAKEPQDWPLIILLLIDLKILMLLLFQFFKPLDSIVLDRTFYNSWSVFS